MPQDKEPKISNRTKKFLNDNPYLKYPYFYPEDPSEMIDNTQPSYNNPKNILNDIINNKLMQTAKKQFDQYALDPKIEQDSDFFKLNENQINLLKKGNNLKRIKSLYEIDPENMNSFLNKFSNEETKDILNNYSKEEKRYPTALENNKEWYKEWYKKRAELPEFKDVANQRYNITDSEINSNISDKYNINIDNYFKPTHYSKDSNIPNLNERIPFTAYYNPLSNKTVYNIKNLDKRYFEDVNNKVQNSLITHEESHRRDHLYPQKGVRYDSLKDWGKGDDPLEKIISQEHIDKEAEKYKNKEPGSFNALYQYEPTEIRARLNVWRQMNNIEPTKQYTLDEINEIMKKDIYKREKLDYNIDELYRNLEYDPSDLLYLHNSYVKNKEKNPYLNYG